MDIGPVVSYWVCCVAVWLFRDELKREFLLFITFQCLMNPPLLHLNTASFLTHYTWNFNTGYFWSAVAIIQSFVCVLFNQNGAMRMLMNELIRSWSRCKVFMNNPLWRHIGVLLCWSFLLCNVLRFILKTIVEFHDFLHFRIITIMLSLLIIPNIF